MTRPQKAAAAITALAITALINLTVTALQQPHPPAPRAAPTATPISSADTTATTTATATATPEPPLPTSALDTNPRVRARAARFLTAYARYDVGRRRARVRARLRATTTPRLWRALRSNPPRPGGAGYPPPGRIIRLRVFRRVGGWQATAGLQPPRGQHRRITIALADTPDGPRADTVLP